MLRFLRLALLVLGFYLAPLQALAQDGADSQALGVDETVQQTDQQAQERRARIEELRQLSQEEREARRVERQRQIDSLTDEQRKALGERRRLREANGARQQGQRPPRRRPPAAAAQEPESQTENDEPA